MRTPHICKDSMFVRSGHLPYYAESMFPPMEMEGVKYYLKPMNCPHHHKVFASVPRSYRDLPLRLAEYGTCYRYEQSGELFGLMRVRSMQMNDAHIYCTLGQFEEEFLAVCRMYLGYFELFGIDKYVMRFSTHEPQDLGKKYVDEPELWVETEERVRRALANGGINHVEVAGEAAFYGPKIDVEVWSAIGREFSIATNQVDFAVPARYGLVYTNAEGGQETPICIHRAPLGTHERTIGFLIEHYAGAFPPWLAPVQAVVLPIGGGHADFAGMGRGRPCGGRGARRGRGGQHPRLPHPRRADAEGPLHADCRRPRGRKRRGVDPAALRRAARLDGGLRGGGPDRRAHRLQVRGAGRVGDRYGSCRHEVREIPGRAG